MDQHAVPRRGLTIPFDGVELAAHRDLFRHAAAAGFTDLWSSETNGADGLTPLALAAAWEPTARLGSAILPVHTRGPALMAMSAAAMAEAAPGRFVLGIGASSPVIVEQWNSVAFDAPYSRVRDTLRFLRRALAGQKVDEEFETFAVHGFRLGRVPRIAPPILLAALRPAMIRLGAREADGVITNWLGVEDVAKVLGELRGAELGEAGSGGVGQGGAESGGAESGGTGLATEGGERPARAELAARIFVCPTEDAAYARALGRTLISSYLTVPAYADFHRWLGREAHLGPMWEAWAAGDRKKANALVPDEVVDALIVHGSSKQCQEHLDRYTAAGIDTPILALLPTPELTSAQALAETITALAPASA